MMEIDSNQEQLIRESGDPPRPKMPDKSGVDEPRRQGRLTDSYFLLKELAPL